MRDSPDITEETKTLLGEMVLTKENAKQVYKDASALYKRDITNSHNKFEMIKCGAVIAAAAVLVTGISYVVYQYSPELAFEDIARIGFCVSTCVMMFATRY